MRSKLFFFSLVLLAGCIHSDPNCTITIDEFIKANKQKVFGTNSSNGLVTEYRDKAKDSIRGGYYTFYSNKHLKSYDFFVNMKTYIYSEEYDTTGALINVKGNPFVHYFANLINDSLAIRMYFFSLNKIYRKINVITNDNRSLNLAFSDDTLYSNMKTASFSYINLKKEKDIISYINIEYQNKCTKQIVSFRDSIILHYTPNK